jgi:hypothetical protein
VLVEVHAHLRGRLAHLVAIHGGRERRRLHLLLHRLGRHPDDPGGAHERDRGDEPGQLVDRVERLRERGLARHAQVRRVAGHGLDQLLRVAQLAQLLEGDPRMAGLQVGVLLVVEVVEDAGGRPQLLVLAALARVGDHAGLDSEHVLSQRVGLGPGAEELPGLVAGDVHRGHPIRQGTVPESRTIRQWPSLP